MEEPPFQRDRGDLFAYALVFALVVALLIGVMIVLGQANSPCNNCTGEGCGGAPPCMQNIQQSL